LGHIAQVREDWDDPESTRPLLRSSLSWGVVHNERYNKKRHEGELTRKIDGEKYAVDRNDWFIHRGDQIQPHEYSHKFSRTYTKGEPDPTLEDTVVVAKYKRDKNTSPASLWDGNVKVACNITSILPPISQEMKNVKIYKPWYKKWEKGNTTIYYEIKLIFGLSDTTAEVWFEGEKRGSAKVTWAGKSAEQDLEKHGKSVRPLNEGRIEEKRKGRWYSRFRS
jgi:hypothetical protein